MLRNALLTGLFAIASSSQCLDVPKWQEPPQDIGDVPDAETTRDSADAMVYSDIGRERNDARPAQDVYDTTQADVHGSDAAILWDAQNSDARIPADVQPEDTADRIVDSGSPDAGNPPNSGYINHFDEQNDLASLLFQGGEWSQHPEGYLQQTESNCENGGWRVAEVENLLSSDFEARMRIRMISDQYVRCGVIHNQTGLLFRYSRERQEGAEEETVRGYALIMGRSSADTFVVSLQDFDQRVLRDELINCGEVGCGYNIWREVGVRAVGTTIAVSLDRQELFSVNDDTYHEGRIGLVAFSYNASHFDDVEICSLR